nr:MAG TPA: hypothetical protein [Caudoviricetes sp.]
MIKTDEFGRVSVGGMIDSLFAEYAAAGRAIAFQKGTTKEY